MGAWIPVVWRSAAVLMAAGASFYFATEGPIFVGLGVVMLLSLPVVLRDPVRLIRAEQGPLRPEIRKLLAERVPYFAGLAHDRDKDFFQRRVQRLLGTLDFEAVGEVNFDLEARVLAVAGAAVIVQGRPAYRFDTQRSVLLYPDRFDDDYAHGDGDILGMVHKQGPIVFSRRALESGWSRENGSNVSIHEWAHVLDFDDAFADGIPGFATDLARWDEILDDERSKAEAGRRTALRRYAGTNRAETFATALEVFFERPKDLQRRNRALYDLLAESLNQSPAETFD
ncbi:MAG: zinc-dependent peptidase [Myxococcota bacterium]